MSYKRFLRLYKGSLRLYPAEFRKRHGEQMYLTAQDMLHDMPTARTIAWLATDTCMGLITEHAKQLKGDDMKKQPKSMVTTVVDSVWLAVQIAMLPLLVYISIRPLLRTYPLLGIEGASVPLIADNLVIGLMPLFLAGLAFWLLGKLHLKLWSRTLSALVIACAATGAFNWLLGMFVVQMWRYRMFVAFGPLWVLADLLWLGAYLAGFYLVGSRVVGQLSLKPAKQAA